MISRSLRHRAPVLWLLVPLIMGLIAGKTGLVTFRVPVLIAIAVVACGVAALPRLPELAWAVAFCAMGVFGGAALYTMEVRHLAQWDTVAPREARVQLRVERVFEPRPGSKHVNGIGVLVEPEPRFAELARQRIYFSATHRPGESIPIRTEVIALRGVLSPIPRSSEPTTFDGFLLNAGVNFQLNRARPFQSVRPPTRYARFCDGVRIRLAGILARGLEHQAPLVAVYRGMLLGEVAELNEDQQLWFRETGTMHLFAIAGLHIAAIAVALRMLLGFLRLPAFVHLVMSLGILWVYVDVIGRTPSAVRAFTMIALLETAYVLRRSVNPVATLMTGAFVALLANPMQLFSASYQMSYGIVSALLLLGLPLAERWQEKWIPFRNLPKATWSWPHHAVSWSFRALTSAGAIGLSTGALSAIAGVLYFKLFTPGALLANLVLIPAASLVLWSGFLSILCGLSGATAFCTVFNHAAALTLLAMQSCIRILVTVPGTYVASEFRATAVGYAALGGLVIILLVGYCFQWSARNGRWWLPFGWVAAALIFGAKFG